MPEPKLFTFLIQPKVAEAEIVVKEAILRHLALVVVGRCWVHYLGRAKSKLELGERIMMIKKDGSLLVHRSVGYEPVNWQPPGCIFHTQSRGDVLEVHAVRQKPAESIQAYFDRVYLIASLDLLDAGEFSLYASEEDMHKAILLKPSILEEGFKPISYEKKVEPGFVDVYGVDKDGRLVVVEVKRKTATKEAALQLAKYIEAVRTKADRKVRGILAAPNMGKDVQKTLETMSLEFKQVDPRKCAETLQRAETRKLSDFFERK